ncbi:unnamed protein product [Bursaphelenchus xylophilus]|uniref:maleylacetoacetate isomerase n=1 Tax=Bursaphelenchus xylophilus TaxID=6326 RepID=A0A1I7SM57_BURXY|nr:unnamed protein product [Bursaphelenchus xylophilus]CAG9130005.1 unnamed protein product [Bursaphelenchus xylophilus]
MSEPILYSYWRSSCSWRVRIALELKKVQYQQVHIHLLNQEQSEEKYLQINPAGMIPTFVHDGNVITESLAILEYLDEVFEGPKLIYGNAAKKALIRSLALIIISNIQPLQNPRVTAVHSNDKAKREEFARHFIDRGFETLEKRLKATAGKYSVGDELSLVDVCIPSQVYSAIRFNVDMRKFPIIQRINEELGKLPAFIKADEKHQPDTPAEFRAEIEK